MYVSVEVILCTRCRGDFGVLSQGFKRFLNGQGDLVCILTAPFEPYIYPSYPHNLFTKRTQPTTLMGVGFKVQR